MRRLLLGVLALALLVFTPVMPAHAGTTVSPQIQLVAAGKLTYESQTTTVTGTVTYSAADGTTQPLANQTVQITCYYACTDFTATTDASGQFTVPVTAGWWEIEVTATIAATGTVAAASNTLWMYPHSPTRITAAVTPGVLTSSTQSVTISGALQYQGDDGTWKPLPGRIVSVSGGGADTTITTASDGTFTGEVADSAATAPVSQQFTVGWSPWVNGTTVDETFFGAASTSVTVTNPAVVTFTAFQATANLDGTVTVTGALAITPATSVAVQLEYSADGTTGWTPLGSPETTSSALAWYPAAPLPTAFYRAVVAPGPGNLGATSPVVKAGRTVTQITGFKVSATKVRVGHSFKITGTLQQDVSSTWIALANQQVWILLQPKGSSTWYWYSKPVTNSSGAFSATIKVIKGMPSAWWIPVYYGADGYYPSSPANPVHVSVH